VRNASAALLLSALYGVPLVAGVPSAEPRELLAVPANADSDISRERQVSVNLCSDLQCGWRLNSGESLFSALGGFRLIMQDDGNLVLYAIDDMKIPSDFLHVFSCTPDVLKLYAKPIWSTGTHVPHPGIGRGSYCAMEENGNLVVYDQAQHRCFETRTGGHPGSYLRLQTDGNLVIYTRDLKAAWSSNTAARPSRGPEPGRPPAARRRANQGDRSVQGRLSKDLRSGMRLNVGDSLFSPLGGFRLVLQDDGNLVLYVIDDMRIPWDASLIVYHDVSILGIYQDAIWSSATHLREQDAGPGAYCVMKDDGNFIIYDEDDKPCFQSGTKGNPGAFLRCQDDGNLVIYTRDNKAIWQSKTYARIDDVPVAK
jgi:hypothetical protein